MVGHNQSTGNQSVAERQSGDITKVVSNLSIMKMEHEEQTENKLFFHKTGEYLRHLEYDGVGTGQ